MQLDVLEGWIGLGELWMMKGRILDKEVTLT